MFCFHLCLHVCTVKLQIGIVLLLAACFAKMQTYYHSSGEVPSATYQSFEQTPVVARQAWPTRVLVCAAMVFVCVVAFLTYGVLPSPAGPRPVQCRFPPDHCGATWCPVPGFVEIHGIRNHIMSCISFDEAQPESLAEAEEV